MPQPDPLRGPLSSSGASPYLLSFMIVKVTRQNQLEGELVRPVGQANTDAGFDVPRLAGIVDDPVRLMCLLTSGVELV